MARKYNNVKEIYGILFMVLLTFPTIKTENIDCYGKSFHCVNSTHFMICVGVGEGLSSTVDDFIIPCPTATECHRSNNFECEFPPSTTPTTIINSSDVANEFENYEYSTKPPWENFDTTMVLTPKYNERPYGYEQDLNSRKNSYTISNSEIPTIKPKYAEFNKAETVTVTPTATPTTPDIEHLSIHKSLDTYLVAPTAHSVLATDLSDRTQFGVSSAKSKYEPETNTEIPPDTHSTSMNSINETGREISQNKLDETKSSNDNITLDFSSISSSLDSLIDTTVVNNSNIIEMNNSKNLLASTPQVELFESKSTVDISVVPTQPSEKYSQTPGDVKTTYPTNINAEELYNVTENGPLNSPNIIEVIDYQDFSNSGLPEESVNNTAIVNENYNVKPDNSMDGFSSKKTDAFDPAQQIYPLNDTTESVIVPPLKESKPNLTAYDHNKNSSQITNTVALNNGDSLNLSTSTLNLISTTPSPSIPLDKIEEIAQTIIDTLNRDSINKQFDNKTQLTKSEIHLDKPKLNKEHNTIGKIIETEYGSLGKTEITTHESKPSSLETVTNIQRTTDMTVLDVTTVPENEHIFKPDIIFNELTSPEDIELLITKGLNSGNNTVLVPDTPLEYVDKTNDDIAVLNNLSISNNTGDKPTIVSDDTPMWNDVSNINDNITDSIIIATKYYSDDNLTKNYHDNMKFSDKSKNDMITPFQHDTKSVFSNTTLETVTQQNKEKELLDYIPVLITGEIINNPSNNVTTPKNIDNTLSTNNPNIDNTDKKIYTKLMNNTLPHNTTIKEGHETTINYLSPNLNLSSLDINDANIYDEIIGQYRSTRNLDSESTLTVTDSNNHKTLNEFKNVADQFVKPINAQENFQTTKQQVAEVDSVIMFDSKLDHKINSNATATKELSSEKPDSSNPLQHRTQNIPSTINTSKNTALSNEYSTDKPFNSHGSNELKKINEKIYNDGTMDETSTRYPDALNSFGLLDINAALQSEEKSTAMPNILIDKENNSDSLSLMTPGPKILYKKEVDQPLLYGDFKFYAHNTTEDGIDKLMVILEDSLIKESKQSLNKNTTKNDAIPDNVTNNYYDSKDNHNITKIQITSKDISDNPNPSPNTTQQNTFTQSQIPTNLQTVIFSSNSSYMKPFTQSTTGSQLELTQTFTPTSLQSDPFTQTSTATSSLSGSFTQISTPTSSDLKQFAQSMTPTSPQSEPFNESSAPFGAQSQTLIPSSSPISSQSYPVTQSSTSTEPFTQSSTPSSLQSQPFTPSSISTEKYTQSPTQSSSLSQPFTQSSTSTEPFTPTSTATGYHSNVFSQSSRPTGSRSDPFTQSSTPTGSQSDLFSQSLTPTNSRSDPFTQSSIPKGPLSDPFTQSSTPTGSQSDLFSQSSTPTGSQSDLFSQSLTPTNSRSDPFTQSSIPIGPYIQSSTPSGYHTGVKLHQSSSARDFRSDPLTQSLTQAEPSNHTSTSTGYHSNVFSQSSRPTGPLSDPFTQTSTLTSSHSDLSTQSSTKLFTQSSTPTESQSDLFTQSSTPSGTPTASMAHSSTPTESFIQSSTEPFTQSSTPSGTPTATITHSSTPTESFTQSSTPTETFTQSSTPTSFQSDPFTRILSNAQTVTKSDHKLIYTAPKTNTSIKETIYVSAGDRKKENEDKDLQTNTTHRPNVFRNNFKCQRHIRGKFADKTDCRKYYICIGYEQPLQGYCPNNTVYSEINKSCTKNLLHCMKNYNFECPTEGRFVDYLIKNTYYICLRNQNKQMYNKYKFQCLPGYQLNKKLVKCLSAPNVDHLSSNDSKSSKSNSENESISKKRTNDTLNIHFAPFQCTEEGKFPDPNDKNCRVYYECKSKNNRYRRKRRRCENDEYFDPDSEKCVDTDSYECEY